jgi:hypothetical protein
MFGKVHRSAVFQGLIRDEEAAGSKSNCQDLWIEHFTQWFGGLESRVRQSRSSGIAALVSPFWF